MLFYQTNTLHEKIKDMKRSQAMDILSKEIKRERERFFIRLYKTLWIYLPIEEYRMHIFSDAILSYRKT